MRGPPWALVALVIVAAASCGGGTDSKPVAPPTAPQAAPERPPEPPTVRAVVWVLSEPSDPGGYYTGEKIRVIADFEQPVSVVDSPRLAIEIGEHRRLADFLPWWEDNWPPERPSWRQRFEYEVGPDDADADGITIPPDAFDFSEGALLNRAGREVEIQISAIGPEHSPSNPLDPGKDLVSHPVIGTAEPRACTDERERAENHSRFVREWDRVPFRVDMIRNFPDVVTDADVVQLLEPVGLLADKIEEQIGYRIVEMGEVIPVPKGAPPGWNEDEQEFRRTCPLPRDSGQIQGFYMDDVNHGNPSTEGQANSACGSFSYMAPLMVSWPCQGCEVTGNGSDLDGLTLHELFHVLGFVHFDDYDFLARGDGVPMSVPLTWTQGRGADSALWPDIDLLRCIFPKEG